ncbi:MAG: DeoR/GlpR transcriptional regulator [Clostridia bacterium]|nr:DeoR/GlpR transcriptional regulator [Clostridia bacterium]
MLAEERRERISLMLRDEKRVSVGELSASFNVSEETIRRDLEKLESSGIARRTYGGALLNEDERKETPYDVRKRSDVNAKYAIAKLASGLISDGEYIMLDESSTSFYIACQLKHLKNRTVITNSMVIVSEISSVPGWTVLCTGGLKRQNAPSFAGRQAENMVRAYHVDKAIISCSCLDIDVGFTDRHEDTALIKMAMMASAKQVILAVDSGKFDKVAFASIGRLDQIKTVVTDTEPDERWKEAFSARDIKLLFDHRRGDN